MRLRIALIVLGLAAIVGGVFGYLGWTIRQPPTFYVQELQREVDPVEVRQNAKEFVQASLELEDRMRHDDNWSESFTQDQVNAWLSHDLPQQYSSLLPKAIQEPRVHIDGESVELALRYEDSRLSGIISLRVKPTVAGPNQIALEIESVRLGRLPIPLDQVLDKIAPTLEAKVAKLGWKIEWQQTDGRDVMLVHITLPGKKLPILEALQVEGGALSVSGRSGVSSHVNSSVRL